jgi:osmotically inducible lipoprotein OsmB
MTPWRLLARGAFPWQDRSRPEMETSQMKTFILSLAAIATVGLSASYASAGPVAGAAIGAGTGAVVAGPPGAVVGGVAGAIVGDRNHRHYRHHRRHHPHA